MDHVFVSVLVPVYNTADDLPHCLDSLLAQTLEEIEIICVNDGSTDASPRILREYAKRDARIVIVDQPNRGLPAARNAGLDRARGEYVAFVDSDDYVEPNMMERLYRTAVADRSEIVICGAEVFPAEPPPPPWLQAALSPRACHYSEFSKDILFQERGTHPFLWRTVIKRELFLREGIRFHEEIVLGEDLAMQFRTYPVARGITVIPDKLYHYHRNRAGSIMQEATRDVAERVSKHIKLCTHVIGEWNKLPTFGDLRAELLSWSIELLFYDLIKLSLAERQPLAAQITALWDAYGFKIHRSALPPHLARMLRYFYDVAAAPPPEAVEVSVIVNLCRGDPDTVAKLLENLSGQTLKNVEWIFVHSADYATYVCLRERLFADLRVRILLRTPASPADAFSEGLHAAAGAFVLPADIDTRLPSPTTIEEQLRARRAGVEPTAITQLLATKDPASALNDRRLYGLLLKKSCLLKKEAPILRLQNIVLPSGEYPSLYFRGGVYGDGGISLKAGEELSLDTYFNCMNYPKYRDLTTVKQISLHLNFTGDARVRLCTYDGTEEVTVDTADGNGGCILSATLSDLPPQAILYPVISAKTDVRVLGGEYLTEGTGADVDVAIAICTYRREAYLYHNLQILANSAIPHLSHVIVVDNGGTVEESRLVGKRVSLFSNPNYGGSAGFTRGLIEAKRAGHTHVILMDDDIVIYPDTIARMTVFASLLRPEYQNAHFSATMLPTSHLYLQHEKGARWDGTRIQSIHTKLDVRERDALIENLEDGPIEYGAWWCFCLPLSDVDEFGLPLPFFIKFDDVEYGTRCCKNAPIVTMNGMAVAHEDFESKYNMHLDYYNVRNQLITLAVHHRQNRFTCMLRLLKASARHLFLYRYSAVPIVLRAFTDFLKGADFLMTENAEELNRSLMQSVPKPIQLSEQAGWDPQIRERYTPSKKNFLLLLIKLITLGGHIFPNLFLSKKKTVFAPLSTAKPGDCYLRVNTVQYQMVGDSGYVFQKSSPKFFCALWSVFIMSLRILFGYGRAAKSYRKNEARLTSTEFWEQYLGLK